uniref:Uncharacterized protein n=1 Tax=Aegilops tauschii subsp. strangulata TaxID=200361 RepID=A0A453BKD6_AEGTS
MDNLMWRDLSANWHTSSLDRSSSPSASAPWRTVSSFLRTAASIRYSTSHN